ncbi:hypothetical protein H0H81_006827, partial [Sphagnurus paluster]
MDSQLGTRTLNQQPQSFYQIHAIIIYMDSRLRRIAIAYLKCLAKYDKESDEVEWFEERLKVELNVTLQYVGAAAAMLQISETPIITRLLTCLFYTPSHPDMEALRNALAVNIDPDDPGTPLEDKHYPQHWWCHLKSTGSNAETVNVKYLEEYTESYNRRLNMLLPPRLSSHSYNISKLVKDVGEVFAQASNYSVIFEHRERFSACHTSDLMALYELGAQRTIPDDVPTVEDVRHLFDEEEGTGVYWIS